jgi:hypothetical protein
MIAYDTIIQSKKDTLKLGIVAYLYNPSTWEACAGRFHFQGQPGQYRQTLPQTNKTKALLDHSSAFPGEKTIVVNIITILLIFFIC